MIPKGFPHHPHHFFRQIGPITPRFEPILWHAWWNLAVFWLYHAQKTAFSSRKKIDPKRHPKTYKRLPTSSKCRNALFLIIFSRRFTHVSLGSSHAHAYFVWASTWICMGPDLKITLEVKQAEIFRVLLLLYELVRKGFPHHPHHFFRRKSINLTPLEPNLRPV